MSLAPRFDLAGVQLGKSDIRMVSREIAAGSSRDVLRHGSWEHTVLVQECELCGRKSRGERGTKMYTGNHDAGLYDFVCGGEVSLDEQIV
jgi:hypothetical protein